MALSPAIHPFSQKELRANEALRFSFRPNLRTFSLPMIVALLSLVLFFIPFVVSKKLESLYVFYFATRLKQPALVTW